MATLTSAAGVVSLLDEPEVALKVFALEKLNDIVDHFWSEIADSITKIEILYEDETFSHQELAALVASKVYYHLGEYEDSMQYALGAGSLFDVTATSEYVNTIISKGIDTYIEKCVAQHDLGEKVTMDERLKDVVERMFQRCFDDKEYKQAVGIALESRRLDVLRKAITESGQQEELLVYSRKIALSLIENIDFRNSVLLLLVLLYQELPQPDYVSVCQLLVFLNDPIQCANILQTLVKQEKEESLLIAYQIAFDLYENATQEYLKKVIDLLPKGVKKQQGDASAKDASQDAMETDKLLETNDVVDDPLGDRFYNISKILSGEKSISLNLEFLYRSNHSDLLILNKTKSCLEAKSSLHHAALSLSHAFMHAGTTSDDFLRNNMDWMGKASNWTKFSATASLGVIHKGQIAQGMKLLKTYLPQDGVSGSPFSEGGALFGLGYIHANHGYGAGSVISYLTNALKNTQTEVIEHGACLGLGVAGMATDNSAIYEDIKEVLFSDSAVAGEAAGIAMGLVMLGTANAAAIEEMLQYAHETQHEKIIRGLAIGISLIMYGQEEKADSLIEQLSHDKDPILRYGGIYTIALAYCGTGNNKAIQRLLHDAVSDANDDVRRASVMALGFVLFRTPKQVPRLVQLLSESYNPHVRYGATLALGISCAGTGLQEAIHLLMPMTKDSTDFVRQGALLSLSMIMVQQNEVTCPQVKEVRELYTKVIGTKHESALCKFGAIMSQGIIDAGGRNVTISLQSASGHSNMFAIVGLAIFTQYWYWFPLAHFLPLAFSPTAMIGLNKDLAMPKFEFKSNAKPSQYAYPPASKAATTSAPEKVTTAVLSTTAKAKARAKKSEKQKKEQAMDTDEKQDDAKEEGTSEDKAEAMVIEEEGEKGKEEVTSEDLQNLARVVPEQLKHVVFKEDSRYVPVIKKLTGSIVLLRDTKPGETEDIMESSVPAPPEEKEEKEASPPEPFEYTE